MTITGKIIYTIPIKVGQRKDGTEWAVKYYVLEELGTAYPQRLYFRVFGTDDMMYFNLAVGDIVMVRFEMSVLRTESGFFNIATAYNVKKVPIEKIRYNNRIVQPPKPKQKKLKDKKDERAAKKKRKRKVKKTFDINSLPF